MKLPKLINEDSLLVEHVPFDLEWAKRGGIVAADWEDGSTFLYYLNKKSNKFENLNFEFDDFFEADKDFVSGGLLRMATTAEAGVEYIEKPVSAEELAELRKDSERLDYLLNDGGAIVGKQLNGEFGVFSLRDLSTPLSVGLSPRKAIDAARAAMKGVE